MGTEKTRLLGRLVARVQELHESMYFAGLEAKVTDMTEKLG